MGNQDVQAADPRQPGERGQSLLELSRLVAEANDRRALFRQIHRPDPLTQAATGEWGAS
jgi:hypothetical protein